MFSLNFEIRVLKCGGVFMFVYGGFVGDENVFRFLDFFSLIMCICLGRVIFEFKDFGSLLKGVRDCIYGVNGKGG